MISNPTIRDYKPFYIQYGSNTTATDTKTAWGMIAKMNPFPMLPSPKEPYKNEWLDENGDEEYTSAIYYQSIEFTVSFYIRAVPTVTSGVVTETAVETIRSNMASFFNAIKTGNFKIYDSYTGIGRQNVRYDGFEEDTFKAYSEGSVSEHYAYTIFKVKFKCNDPLTFMRLTNNAIVTIS